MRGSATVATEFTFVGLEAATGAAVKGATE